MQPKSNLPTLSQRMCVILWTVDTCMWVCLCVSVFTKVPESVRGVPFQLPLNDSRAVACIQCRVLRFNFRLSDRGRTVPWIGVCRACHGSGCAVPAVPFTTSHDTRRVVKNREDLSTNLKDEKSLAGCIDYFYFQCQEHYYQYSIVKYHSPLFHKKILPQGLHLATDIDLGLEMNLSKCSLSYQLKKCQDFCASNLMIIHQC